MFDDHTARKQFLADEELLQRAGKFRWHAAPVGDDGHEVKVGGHREASIRGWFASQDALGSPHSHEVETVGLSAQRDVGGEFGQTEQTAAVAPFA